MAPIQAPVDRLLRKAQDYRDAHPADADANYTLARIHYLTFSNGALNIPSLPTPEDDPKQAVPEDWMIGYDLYEARQKHASELAAKDLQERNPKAPAITFEEARGRRARELEERNWRPKGDLPASAMEAHAAAASAGFREAIRLNPKNGLYPLGLACLAEEFADWIGSRKLSGVPPELRGLTHAAARALYSQAFRLAIAGDASLPNLPPSGIASLVSAEAGGAYIRLAERDHARLNPGEKASLAELKLGISKLKRIPIGAITPIIFSLNPAAHIDSLLAKRKRVSFDLRGYGKRGVWPWVSPGTAILVWDPQSRGVITSARQLFGSYSFEIFRRNGFEALEALDDNEDGVLSGGELSGIRVWIDADGEGICHPGDVHDLSEFGIMSIAVHPTSYEGPHPANAEGITLQDGISLPMWDWVVKPVRTRR